jgi:transcriptional regulator with GAF, ATPase, and Fis domain
MTMKSRKAAELRSEPDSEAARRKDLAQTFVELADTMVADFDLLDFLHVLAERTVSLLDAEAAGLMLSDHRGRLRVLASTNEQSRLLELFELQNAEGPCLDSFHSGEQVVNIDLAEARRRWPTFAPVAAAAGFESVHALPLRLRGTVIGAVNLFCGAERLSAEDVVVGQALADVATIGLLSQRSEDSREIAETLQVALNSRIVLEQAKGVLAETLRIDMDKGFDLIRSHAHLVGSKLTTVAGGVIDGSIRASSLKADTPAPASWT